MLNSLREASQYTYQIFTNLQEYYCLPAAGHSSGLSEHISVTFTSNLGINCDDNDQDLANRINETFISIMNSYLGLPEGLCFLMTETNVSKLRLIQ